MRLTKHDDLRSLEAERINSLVAPDMGIADRLHAQGYELITPRGVALSRADYLGSIASGTLNYKRFEVLSEIQVLGGDGGIAVLRYKSAIDVDSGSGSWSAICWHTDCYRREPEKGWQAVWSQATRIDDGDIPVGCVHS